ncbi:MAG: xanthine dehydrogenase family protein subunit M [Chloroflexi bacterium]|nr:xanthine dehydrogenase family protein subunit M [Chloroflexota bacterium]
MKPAPFCYHAPASVAEAISLLRDLRDEDAKVLAGGQSLMPMVNMRLARPAHLVDINGIDDLAHISCPDDGGLAIGALTRQRRLERSAEVARRAPLLAEALPLIGDRLVRSRGTIGGSLAHADPTAELPVVAVALDAEIGVVGPQGARPVPSSQFFVSVLTTAVEVDELLVEVRLPPATPGEGYAFVELARQHGAFAIVAVAASVALDDGHIREARIALGGVAPIPVRAWEAEEALRGQPFIPETLARAAEMTAAATDPMPDVHGSPEYRRAMAAVHTRRALQLAGDRATSTGGAAGA